MDNYVIPTEVDGTKDPEYSQFRRRLTRVCNDFPMGVLTGVLDSPRRLEENAPPRRLRERR